MGIGVPHLLIFAFVVLLLFGGGRISNLMGDVAKGIKSFKKGMNEDDDAQEQAQTPAPRIESPSAVTEAEKHNDKQV